MIPVPSAVLIEELVGKELITPPKWLPSSVSYETVMGSQAYGVSNDNSDLDVYGFCVPPKEVVFPHVAGVIQGFGKQHQPFEQYQQHHIKDVENGREYDISMYNIVKYFDLCMGCNPNMIDSLFTPQSAVLFESTIARKVRANRHLFLSKLAWPTFRGYAYSQIGKIANKKPTGHRLVLVEKYGYDVKYAYHLVRLLDEAEQILRNGDIDLTRDKERLKEIRNGKWTEDRVHTFFKDKDKELDEAARVSELQDKPDEARLKKLLIECLEETYGTLEGVLKYQE